MSQTAEFIMKKCDKAANLRNIWKFLCFFRLFERISWKK